MLLPSPKPQNYFIFVHCAMLRGRKCEPTSGFPKRRSFKDTSRRAASNSCCLSRELRVEARCGAWCGCGLSVAGHFVCWCPTSSSARFVIATHYLHRPAGDPATSGTTPSFLAPRDRLYAVQSLCGKAHYASLRGAGITASILINKESSVRTPEFADLRHL
jgi:hypothetical protein